MVVLIGGAVLRYTRFGRHTYVIGSNDEAARRAGINVNRHLVKLYAISGGLAGLAGMMSLVRFSTTTIGGHSQDALTVITGVILGGTSLYGGYGVVLGTVIGIFIPTVLQNGLVVKASSRSGRTWRSASSSSPRSTSTSSSGGPATGRDRIQSLLTLVHRTHPTEKDRR